MPATPTEPTRSDDTAVLPGGKKATVRDITMLKEFLAEVRPDMSKKERAKFLKEWLNGR